MIWIPCRQRQCTYLFAFEVDQPEPATGWPGSALANVDSDTCPDCGTVAPTTAQAQQYLDTMMEDNHGN